MVPMWFDIPEGNSRDRPERQDREGMESTRAMVERLIGEEREQGRKVLLGGFSQGLFEPCSFFLLSFKDRPLEKP